MTKNKGPVINGYILPRLRSIFPLPVLMALLIVVIAPSAHAQQRKLSAPKPAGATLLIQTDTYLALICG
ncbi:MAG: hypothetical protein WCG81_20810 [Candidatus Angelobacter sp.]